MCLCEKPASWSVWTLQFIPQTLVRIQSMERTLLEILYGGVLLQFEALLVMITAVINFQLTIVKKQFKLGELFRSILRVNCALSLHTVFISNLEIAQKSAAITNK